MRVPPTRLPNSTRIPECGVERSMVPSGPFASAGVYDAWKGDGFFAMMLLTLMKEPSQRRAASRHDAGVREVMAAAVGVPDGVLIGSRYLPGNLVAARRLLR